MKAGPLSLAAVALLTLVALALFLKPTPREPTPSTAVSPITAPLPPPAAPAPPGDEILTDYASPHTDIRADLRQVYSVIGNFQVLAKVDGALPLGSNEEIVRALTGNNPVKLAFLSPDHPAINPDGQLVDRWNTPLFFHALSRDRIEIRSAGPDQTLWTEDDINRRPDGIVETGPGTAGLNAAP